MTPFITEKKYSVTHRLPSGTAASDISLFFFFVSRLPAVPSCVPLVAIPPDNIYAPNMKYKSRKGPECMGQQMKISLLDKPRWPEMPDEGSTSAKQLGSARYKTLSITARPASHLSKRGVESSRD